jgi:hypothetical protein
MTTMTTMTTMPNALFDVVDVPLSFSLSLSLSDSISEVYQSQRLDKLNGTRPGSVRSYRMRRDKMQHPAGNQQATVSVPCFLNHLLQYTFVQQYEVYHVGLDRTIGS